MKKRTSNYLVKILFILLAAIPFGCQQDELIKEEHQGHTKSTYKRNKISYTEYLNSIKELKGFDDKYISNNNKNGGFITAIDTTNIIAYTNEDLTTYTFKVYTTTDNFTNSTNRLVKSKDGQVDTYLIRYIPSSTYRSNLRNSTDGKIEYDGYAQLLGEDGQLIFEQKIINGNSINQSTGCVPHILGEGGYWLCAANNKHSPEPCPVTCNNCDNDFTWVPFQVSILNGCNGGGGNNNNGDSSDNDTNNNGGGGGSGNNDNDNNDNNNNNNDSSNAPDLPTEPVLGGGEDIPIEDYFNPYLCQDMSVPEDTNWAYDNHDEATIIWNYIFNNYQANGDCIEVDFEDKLVIDSSFKNNQKAKCVYDRMKNLNGSVFSDLLSNFDGNTNAQLTFKVANIPQTNPNIYYNAKTLPRFGGSLRTFDIVLDEQFVQNSSLIEIALTLFHELIHAEIMERCIQLGIISSLNNNSNGEVGVNFSNGSIGTTNLPDLLFSMLVDNYSNYSDPNNQSNPNWQHELFSILNYREQISTSLEQVHLLLNDPNNPFESNLNSNVQIPLTMEEYFELMSWLGLEGTMEYENLTNLEITKLNQAYNQTNIYYNENCI